MEYVLSRGCWQDPGDHGRDFCDSRSEAPEAQTGDVSCPVAHSRCIAELGLVHPVSVESKATLHVSEGFCFLVFILFFFKAVLSIQNSCPIQITLL